MEEVIVRIIGCPYKSCWYYGLIGKTFRCYKGRREYIVKKDYDRGYKAYWRHITKDDCVELFGWKEDGTL